MATLRLLGFASEGFSSYRECIVRFVRPETTWGEIQEIAEEIAFEMRCSVDPFITAQSPTHTVDRLAVFEGSLERWRYAVQAGATQLGYDEWRNTSYQVPKVVFEVVEDE